MFELPVQVVALFSYCVQLRFKLCTFLSQILYRIIQLSGIKFFFM